MSVPKEQSVPLEAYHRFLDEAGDTTFYGRGKTPIIGTQGVSLCLILGMVKIRSPLEPIRNDIRKLQRQIEGDLYYREVPSIHKKKSGKGFYFHASDNIPEVRKTFFEFIRTINCSFEAVVGRKIPSLFYYKHNNKETEFYADLLSHLLKNKMALGERLVLNVAERGKTTRNETLQLALNKAVARFLKKRPEDKLRTSVVFNIQNHVTEPLLNVADYFCWAVQRVFERGEMRYYNYIEDKVSLVVDLYDTEGYKGSKNYYDERNRLSANNKLSPPLYSEGYPSTT